MPNEHGHVNVQHAHTPEYRKTLEGIAASGDCPAPFCQEEAGYHSNPIICRTEFWKATRNSYNYQGAEAAFVIVLKRHAEHVSDLSTEEWADLQVIADRLCLAHKITGATLMMRFGETARTGASVAHLHAHLIVGHPRQSGAEPITPVVGFNAPK